MRKKIKTKNSYKKSCNSTSPIELKKGFTRNQSNTSTAITHAKTKMTATELKAFYQISTLIQKDDTDFNEYNISVKDFCEKLNINESNRDFIVNTCKSLLRQVFEIEQENKSYLGFTIFSKMHYKHDEQKINFKFNDDVKPYLLQLKENFTQIQEVKYIREFESKYAIRIYAMLKDYRLMKQREFNIEKLSEILQLPKSYRNFSYINEKVLEPAVTEINAKSDLLISKVERIKTSRKVTSIIIHYDDKLKITAQTQKARETKNLKKYINKEFIYFGAIFKIVEVRINAEYNRVEAIYQDEQNKGLLRADFQNIEHLDIAIQNAKILKYDMKNHPEKYEKKDRSKEITNLFSNFAK